MNDSKINCLIVDDEPLATKVIQSHLEKVGDVEIVAVCHSALDAFSVLRKETIDLVFLDIQMPELTGIEFIQALDRPPRFIFTTAYRDYAIAGFELDAVDYLLKPVSLPRLLRALDKYRRLAPLPSAAGRFEPGETPFLTVRANRQNVNVNLDDILYIESLNDYTRIHTTDKTVVCNEKISRLSRQLETRGFLRIHRSFLAPLSKIDSFTADAITIGRQVLPIGRSYKHAVKTALSAR